MRGGLFARGFYSLFMVGSILPVAGRLDGSVRLSYHHSAESLKISPAVPACFGGPAGADPHRDPHEEASGRKQRSGKGQRPHPFERKPPESIGNKGIEPSQPVGKDEVPSSNLGSSSMKNP